ncbi:NAC-A/B domain-containing protein [Entamoeba marina]
MPKSNKPVRQNAGKVLFVPKTAGQSKQIVADGKKMVVSSNARVGGKGSMRMKSKVVHKGSAAEVKKYEAALKNLKPRQFAGIDECEMIQKNSEGYKITSWKTPKLMSTTDGDVFFVSGANKAESMTEEEFNSASKSQFEEFANQLKGADKGDNNEEVKEEVEDVVEDKEEEVKEEKDEIKQE